MFYGTFCGPKNSPQGVGPHWSGHLGWSGPAARATQTVVSFWRNAFFHKTARSTDRLVALPGRLNLTPRLRGEVVLRGGRGRVKKCGSPMRNRRCLTRADPPKRRPDGQLNGPFCESERFASTKRQVLLSRPAELQPASRFLNEPTALLSLRDSGEVAGRRSGQV